MTTSRAVDYDSIAHAYDRRYAESEYPELKRALLDFVGDVENRVLEVGCGTGHWLAAVAKHASFIAGVDSSREMLRRAGRGARTRVCARAEALPCRSGSFDRIFCVNAFHHFSNRMKFLREARRVLRPSGAIWIAGLDPHTRLDRWWVYDYFPQALALDRARYPSGPALRAELSAAGFARAETREVQHLPARLTAGEAFARGIVEPGFTSQLTILSPEEYAQGVARLRRSMAELADRSEELILSADLRIWGTIGRV